MPPVSARIITDIDAHSAYITIENLPHNSMTGAMLSDLADQISERSRDEKVKVIVLKSEGERVFCAGANFDELMAVNTLAEGKEFFMGFARVIRSMMEAPIPVIVEVQGKTVGGGLGLIAAADYAVANHHATIKLSELSIGIGPFVIAPAIVRKAGVSAYSKLMMESMHWHTAEWAEQQGLYQHLTKNIVHLHEHVDYMVNHLSGFSREALVENKQLLWENDKERIWSEMQANAEKSARLLLTDYTQNKLKSLTSK